MMAALFFLLCYIVRNDIAKRKIYNTSLLLLLVISIGLLVWDSRVYFSAGWQDSLITALVCFLGFLLFYVLGWMGAGDVKLAAVLGLLFGANSFFTIWLISIFISLVYILAVRCSYAAGLEFVRSRLVIGNGGKFIPYGAFLSIAAMLLILHGG